MTSSASVRGMTAEHSRAALTAAFPATPITHAMIHASDARWRDYDEREQLSQLEGVSWTELSPEVLERHAGLLVHAGDELYRVVLPAYLALLAESEHATMLPFLVIGQVTRDERSTFNSDMFETRVGPLSTKQRAAVRRALTEIAIQPALREAATTALSSWAERKTA